MIKYIKGDIILAAQNSEIDVLVQGCNCFCTQGAGLALSIKNTWPEVYAEDCKTKKGDRNKLGTITSFFDKNINVTIINAYTQFTFWDVNDMLSYDAIESCLKLIKTYFSGKRIGLPKIGCGLAGGDWNIVEKIINDVLVDENVTIYLK